MSLPTHAKSWTISSNNRIVYVSLNDTMGRWLKGMADFLLANGYTCKGSCDGTTGAMDAVNRWTTVGNASVRGASSVTANSWMVLVDANGCNICFSYVGGSDDIARISFSPSGAYVAAGTPARTPTATDEQLLLDGATLIATNTSLDRIWHGWVDSQSKLCRFIIMRDSQIVGAMFGVELLSSRVTIPFSPAVWGFAYRQDQVTATGFLNTFFANIRGGKTRINGVSVDIGGGAEVFHGSSTTFHLIKPELQGGVGYPMFPLSVGSSTATRQGPIGDLFDWYSGPSSTQNGNVFNGGGAWVAFGPSTNGGPAASLVWPWDSSTPPQIA